MMAALLATDPGAWNIIGWMLVLAAIGTLILWIATTVLLRGQATDEPDGTSRPQVS